MRRCANSGPWQQPSWILERNLLQVVFARQSCGTDHPSNTCGAAAKHPLKTNRGATGANRLNNERISVLYVRQRISDPLSK